MAYQTVRSRDSVGPTVLDNAAKEGQLFQGQGYLANEKLRGAWCPEGSSENTDWQDQKRETVMSSSLLRNILSRRL